MNFDKILNILFLYYCAANEVPVNYREGYVYSNSTKSFYKFHNIQRNFSIAMATCKSEGSQVIVPTSKNELTEILKLRTLKLNYWIGIHDVYSEGEFVALYGIPFENVYLQWVASEPHSLIYGNSVENCVIIDANGYNYDTSCSNRYNFACKKSIEGLTYNEACEIYDPKYKLMHVLNRCYKFHNKYTNWRQAFKTCKSEKAYLAIINTDYEAQILVDMLSEHPEKLLVGNLNKQGIHAGFSDLLTYGDYLTVKGEELSETGYEKWAQRPFNDSRINSHCGLMLRNGLLETGDCDSNAMFVCEKELKKNKSKEGNVTSVDLV